MATEGHKRGAMPAWTTGGDARALVALAGVLALVVWNRLTFDVWLARYDVVTYYLPWYAEVGERLRELDVPAWNPHQFSGVPLAADPQSGWGYAIVMAAFALLPPLAAFKAMVVAQLGIATLSTYWLGRRLNLSPAGSLVAASAYATGPFLQWDTACCLPFAQLGTWLPLALVGVDLALEVEDDWRERVAPVLVAGFAVSQMAAGWVGEGWIYTALVVGAWAAYRGLARRDGQRRRLGRGLVDGAVVGGATLAVGGLLGAAGILPRLAHNAETNLADGDYERLGVRGLGNGPWDAGYLFQQLLGMGEGYHHRAVGLGGAVVVLTVVGIALGWRRSGTRFFAALTTVVLLLVLEWTPVHWLVYLIPRYEAIHEHDPWRVLTLLAVGPAMLAGIGVDALRGTSVRRAGLLALLPVGAILLVGLTSGELDGVIGWSTLAAGGVVAAATAVLGRAGPGEGGRAETVDGGGRGRTPPLRRRWGPAGWVAVGVVLGAVVAQPFGLEVTGSELGWPPDGRWESTWEPDSSLEPALLEEVRSTDPGGAGGFLAERLREEGPFRYLGYAGVGYPDDPRGGQTYMIRRFQPGVQAVLVNGRPMFLGLYEVQGYNPIQYRRYVELFLAINGQDQGYHTSFVLASGTASPLLDLLNVRYVVIDASLPSDRGDVVALTTGRREVFRSEHAVVYETERPVDHAWIVHDVRETTHGGVLAAMAEPGVDPRVTAFVEGEAPPISEAMCLVPESVETVQTSPESLTIRATVCGDGLLVVSLPFGDGWEATVDGERIDILPTDHALQGVPVPSGDHVVRLRYRPWSLTVGLWVSGAASATMAAALLWRGGVAVRRRQGAVSSRPSSAATLVATASGSTTM